MERRECLLLLLKNSGALMLGASVLPACNDAAAVLPEMIVYKSPTCGCCKEWVEHARAAGFPVEVEDLADVTPQKQKYGVPDDLASCHTAVVGDYVIEGHVPADIIVELLARNDTSLRGVAVPGMPAGSPGMEIRGRKDDYDVIGFTASGQRRVLARR